MNKLHIVHVHEKFYPFMGGSTHRLLNLLKNLDKSKFEITIICENSEKTNLQEKYMDMNIIRFNHYYEIPFILKRLERSSRIDILHTHNFRPSMFAVIANKIFLKKKVVMELHSIYQTTNALKQLIGYKLLNMADRLIVLSERSRDYILSSKYINNRHIDVIFNGIDIEKKNEKELFFNSELESILKEEDNIIVSYMGSLDDFQGIDNVIEIINSVHNNMIKFLLIGGSSDESKEIRKQISNKNIFIEPYIDKKYIDTTYKYSDYSFVVRPSMLSTETAIPLKPLEALINRTTVLASKVGGLLELSEILKTKNIIFFDNNREIIKYLNDLKKPREFIEESYLDQFSQTNQSIKLANIYQEMEDGD